jgi:hypothetical protein
LRVCARTLRNWYNFHYAYDPTFTWWNAEPYKAVEDSLQKYSEFIVAKLIGIPPNDKTTIIGDPIGREALIDELKYEMIPYTPEELVQIANKEFAWCEAEMKKASRDMGYGDDWKKALEAVKQKYVEPGKQDQLIRDQAMEAIEYVEKNDLDHGAEARPRILADGNDVARTTVAEVRSSSAEKRSSFRIRLHR